MSNFPLRNSAILCGSAVYTVLRQLLPQSRRGPQSYAKRTFEAKHCNEDIPTGDFRPINLTEPPFNFPRPLKHIQEKFEPQEVLFSGKILGAWKLSDL